MACCFDSFVYEALSSGTVMWGDILVDEVPTSFEADPIDQPQAIESSVEDDVLVDWTVPDLTLRRGIWENFPVCLLPITDGDGTERYAIVWHRKNLQDWRRDRANSADEFDYYDIFCEERLMYALRQFKHKYTVEPARNNTQICVIAMVFHSAPVSAPEMPVFKRLPEIQTYFPIVWQMEGKTAHIEFHRGKLAAAAAAAGSTNLAEFAEATTASLLEAVSTSTAWTVTASAAPGFLCSLNLY
jgi:hypothetical protein